MNVSLHTERLTLRRPLLARKEVPYTGLVLALNPSAGDCIAAHIHGYKVIGRAEGAWDGDGWQSISPAEYANALGSRLPMDNLYAVTLPKEPNDGDAVWRAQAVREIRSRWPHLYVIVGQWANGHDGFPVPVDPQDLDHIIYGFHGYGRPDKPEQVLYQAQDLALRHRRWIPAVLREQPFARFWCTEFGCTMAAPDFENNGAVGPDIGLLDQEGFDFGAYIRSILIFMWELQQDEDTFTLPQIEAFLFEADAFEKWASMDIRRTPVETWWVQQSLTDGTTRTTTTAGEPASTSSTAITVETLPAKQEDAGAPVITVGEDMDRTEQQQLIIDVVHGVSEELAAPRMTKKRRLNHI